MMLRLLYVPWFWCVAIVGSILLVLFVFPVLFFLHHGRMDAAIRNLTYLFGRVTTRLSWPMMRIEKHGFEKIPNDRPCVLVVNHRSFFDVFLCSHLPAPTAVVVVRYWPSRIPVVGWFIRAGRYIIVEKSSSREIIDRARQARDHDDSMLFFPEGHRSRDGRLQPFRSGAFRAAAATGMPVVPVVLEGTERFLPCGHYLPRPARIRMTILDPVDPAQYPEDKAALYLRRTIQKVYSEFLCETPAVPTKTAQEEE
jgi:1-acyl-sn-glycerol-3-phosphate acyltransferase